VLRRSSRVSDMPRPDVTRQLPSIRQVLARCRARMEVDRWLAVARSDSEALLDRSAVAASAERQRLEHLRDVLVRAGDAARLLPRRRACHGHPGATGPHRDRQALIDEIADRLLGASTALARSGSAHRPEGMRVCLALLDAADDLERLGAGTRSRHGAPPRRDTALHSAAR
jgi:hypothetical protein